MKHANTPMPLLPLPAALLLLLLPALLPALLHAGRPSATATHCDPAQSGHVVIWTDRDIYVAGEHMFFAFHHVPPGNDRDAEAGFGYMAVRGRYGMVERLRLRLSHNGSSGGIYLSDTLSSGYYEVSGFTNLMRNLGEASYFRKMVFIANRFDDLSGFAAPSGGLIPSDENDPGDAAEALVAEASYPGGAAVAPASEASYPGGAAVALVAEASYPGGAAAARLAEGAGRGLTLYPGPHVGRRERMRLRIDPSGLPPAAHAMVVQVVPGQALQSHPTKRKMTPAPQERTMLFFREAGRQILSGRVSDDDGGPVAGCRVVLNVVDTLVNLLYAETGPSGMFHFLLNEYYAGRELVFSVDPATVAGAVTLALIDPFDYSLPFVEPSLPLTAETVAYLRESQDVVRINKAFGIDHVVVAAPGMVPATPPLVYAVPASVTRPGDYLPLDDLPEIARELIPSWRIRTSAARVGHSMVCSSTRSLLPGSPALFVDGVICHDIAPILPLGSDQIREIQVLNRNWMHGNMHMPGIAAVFSHDMTAHHLLPGTVRWLNRSGGATAQFGAPAYAGDREAVQGLPDLRRLIYWNARIGTAEDGPQEFEWYACDLPGDYLVVVRGLTSDGQTFSMQVQFAVE